MNDHQIKLFRSIINQAIHDAMYDGVYKYHIIDKREAITWLTTDSVDFRTICSYAELDSGRANRKFNIAMKEPVYALTNKQKEVLYKPRKKYEKHSGKFRLTFNDA